MKGKIRKCPHCKSTKGYKYDYRIGGYGSVTMDFKGNTIDCERNTIDDVDYYSVTCINCNSKLDAEKVDVGN